MGLKTLVKADHFVLQEDLLHYNRGDILCETETEEVFRGPQPDSPLIFIPSSRMSVLKPLKFDFDSVFLMSDGSTQTGFSSSCEPGLVYADGSVYFKEGSPFEIHLTTRPFPPRYLVKEIFSATDIDMSEGDWMYNEYLFLGKDSGGYPRGITSNYGGEVCRLSKSTLFSKSDTPLKLPKSIVTWGVTKEDLFKIYEEYGHNSFHAFVNHNSTLLKQTMKNIVVQVFGAEVSHKFPGKISLYTNKADKLRERRVALRAGRAFKLMFPTLTDSEVESVVRDFNHDFPVFNFTLKSSKEAEDFKHAYTHDQSSNQDPSTTSARKSLGNSCMRYGYEDLPCHPSEVYASGDFTIYWTETEDGKIGSRCVVYTNTKDGRPVAGPVYGNTEQAIDIIEEEIKKLDGYLFNCGEGGWEGAKIRVVEYNNGYVVPYIDDSDRGCVDQGNGFFKLTGGRADFEACEPEGVVYPNGQYECDACGCSLDEDDYQGGVDGEGCYCSSCWPKRFFVCGINGDVCERSEAVTVYVGPRYRGEGPFREARISDWAFEDGDFYEFEGEYYEDRLITTETHDGEPVPKHLVGEEYFVCQGGNLIYPNSYKCYLDGEEYSSDWIENLDPDTIEYVEGNTYRTKKEEAA